MTNEMIYMKNHCNAAWCNAENYNGLIMIFLNVQNGSLKLKVIDSVEVQNS